MRKSLFLAVPALLLLAACSNTVPETVQPVEPTIEAPAASSSSSSEAPAEVVSSFDSYVLVDQNFTGISDKGIDGLRQMGVKKIKGHIDAANLVLELSNGTEDPAKWGVVAVYFAPLLPAQYDAKGNLTYNEGIDAPKEWKRFRFIGATWNGDCGRHVSPDSFGAVGTEPANQTFDLSALPLTADDENGCDTSQDIVDLVSQMNAVGGGYLGFITQPKTYNLKATLDVQGDIVMSDL